MSETAPHAVFVSYAREDTTAAQRIAEALRSYGVEVWFDQSELRGGEAWDAKIKKQIRECALFLPVVSATTQERREGYFRREWLLAVERTRDMHAGVTFIVPVVINDTREADATVPEEFLRVQWTRLPGALPTPEFVAQMKRLLSAPADAGRGLRTPPQKPAAASPAGFGDPALQPQSRLPAWTWAALAVVMLGAVVYFALRPGTQQSDAPQKSVAATQPTAPSPPPSSLLPSPSRPPEADAKSIAVLPFENRSADKDANAFFADGIHEDVLTNLAHIREFRVISRTSVEQYRATKKSIPQIARELGVTYVLEGSVQRADKAVRITAQLIRAATDEHLWAEKYDYELTAANRFAIQSALAQDIAGALKTALSPQEKSLLARRPTENLQAYELWLKYTEINRLHPDNSRTRNEKISLLQAAVTLDPKFADAWAHLGAWHAYQRLVYDRTPGRLAQATAAIDAAVRLAPDSPEVMFGLGCYHYNAFRAWARAREQGERVLRVDPNHADAIYLLGALARRIGRWAEARAYMDRSLQLDPAGRFNRNQFAQLLEVGRRYGEANAEWRRLAEQFPEEFGFGYYVARNTFRATGSTREVDRFFAGLTPAQADSPTARDLKKTWALVTGNLAEYLRLEPADSRDVTTAIVLAAQGDLAGARTRVPDPAPRRKRLETEPDNEIVWRDLGRIETLLGHTDEALRCARRAVELVPERLDTLDGPASSVALAFVYAWTGDKDRAIAEYARLLRVPYARLNVHEMKMHPYYFPLRGDPRFEALLNDPKNNAPLF